LPTIETCQNLVSNGGKLTYVADGFTRFKDKPENHYSNNWEAALKYNRILPINSDPTSEDSDGDTILDCLDNNYTKTTEFKDPNPLKFDYLFEWPAVGTDNQKLELLRSRIYESEGHSGIHKGIDITPENNGRDLGKKFKIRALYDGTIEFQRKTNSSSMGISIVLRHEINGEILYSRYLHMESIDSKVIDLKDGSKIEKGQVLGVMGNTSTKDKNMGRHLHFDLSTVLLSEIPNDYIDPLLFEDAIKFPKVYAETIDITPSIPINNYLINVPINLECTCDDKETDGCNEYYSLIMEKYYGN
jgi:murein DD-endopeptidase MepM/ murein hydrolase activator NlpD